MAQECDGPDTAMKTVCPLKCRLRHGAAGDNPSSDQATPRDQVDWAGLPIDLDLVFSRKQRDKVYVQHLKRKRETQLGRRLHDDAQLCARGNDCPIAKDGDRAFREIAAENRDLDPDATKAYVQSLSSDKRYYRDVS